MELLTTTAAAALLGLSPRRVRSLADQGVLKADRTPLGRLYDLKSVEALVEARKSDACLKELGTTVSGDGRYVVRVDAAVAPNPGSGGCGVEVRGPDGAVLVSGYVFLGEDRTSPLAELEAIGVGIRVATGTVGSTPLIIETDSDVVAGWLNGRYRCHQRHIRRTLDAVRRRVESGGHHVAWRSRGAWNRSVDDLAKYAARARETSPDLVSLVSGA